MKKYDNSNPPVRECERCGTKLNKRGLCGDVTCPFSDHEQACPVGWVGHPEHLDADEGTRCTCSHLPEALACHAADNHWTPDDVAVLVEIPYDRRHGHTLAALIRQAIDEGGDVSWLRECFSEPPGRITAAAAEESESAGRS